MKYPLLEKPRPWALIGDQPGADARWKNVPEGIDQIDILDRMDLDRECQQRH
jgi:hypothetical protein